MWSFVCTWYCQAVNGLMWSFVCTWYCQAVNGLMWSFVCTWYCQAVNGLMWSFVCTWYCQAVNGLMWSFVCTWYCHLVRLLGHQTWSVAITLHVSIKLSFSIFQEVLIGLKLNLVEMFLTRSWPSFVTVVLITNQAWLPGAEYYYFMPMLEWVSDCCLMPTQQFFSYIMERTS
jgi:hypothetical protein